jgi:O-antigen/teichoic acid export membrane protein
VTIGTAGQGGGAQHDEPEAQSRDILASREAGGHIIRGSALRLAASAAGIALGVVTASLLLRHLGVDESGRYVTVTSLVAIATTIADAGLNVTGSRDLALAAPERRRELIGNLLGLRLMIAPIGLAAVVAFAAAAGYPERMVVGTMLAGAGMFVVAALDALLLPLIVDLRNGRLAAMELIKQVITVSGVALLVAAGAGLTPFFAVQILVAAAALAAAPVLAGRKVFVAPRFERGVQRALISSALPVAAAFVLGQVYFRVVMLVMSLVSSPHETGLFGGSLRATESLAMIAVMIAGIALPLLAAAGRDDHERLRYALQGLSEVAVITGIGVILVTARAAPWVMSVIGGHQFRGAGAVLRIQVAALMFIALSQIWGAALIALHRQRDLIVTNATALVGVGICAAVLVPAFGAEGGAASTVAGDALLAGLVLWRLYRSTDRVRLHARLLGKLALATAVALVPLVVPGLPDVAAAGLSGVLYVAVAQLIGLLPKELPEAFSRRRATAD